MLVYMEAHPVVLEAVFTGVLIAAFYSCTHQISRAIKKTRCDVLKAIQSRNDLLREGFAALASLLANRPCMKIPVEELVDPPQTTDTDDVVQEQ